jgi:hypothetical protein
LTKSGAGVVGTDIEENITVNYKVNESKEVLAVRPGVYYSLDMPTIEIANLGEVDLNVSFLSDTIKLIPSEAYEISLAPETVFSELLISSYKDFNVPIIYLSAKSNVGNQLGDPLGGLRSGDDKIEIVLNKSGALDFSFEIINVGDFRISNLNITDVDNYFNYDYSLFLLPQTAQNVNITTSLFDEGVYTSIINVSYSEGINNFSLELPISLYILPENKTLDEVLVMDKTCDELGGVFCEGGLKCSGTTSFVAGGNCCIGECIDLGENDKGESTSGLGWLWGFVIIIIIGIVGYYFYSNYKKTKPVLAKDSIKDVTSKFETRLKGGNRISGRLEK